MMPSEHIRSYGGGRIVSAFIAACALGCPLVAKAQIQVSEAAQAAARAEAARATHDAAVRFVQSCDAPDGSGAFMPGCAGDTMGGTEIEQIKRDAVRTRNPQLMTMVGDAYQNKQRGMTDMSQAYRWYLLAAVRGDPQAMARLSEMYRSGQSVPQDRVKALGYARLSEKMAAPESATALQARQAARSLSATMARDELAMASRFEAELEQQLRQGGIGGGRQPDAATRMAIPAAISGLGAPAGMPGNPLLPSPATSALDGRTMPGVTGLAVRTMDEPSARPAQSLSRIPIRRAVPQALDVPAIEAVPSSSAPVATKSKTGLPLLESRETPLATEAAPMVQAASTVETVRAAEPVATAEAAPVADAALGKAAPREATASPAALEPTSPVPAEIGVDAAPPAVELQPVPAAVQTAPVAESVPAEVVHQEESVPSVASESVQPAPAETVPEAAPQAPQAHVPVVETPPVAEPVPVTEAAPVVKVVHPQATASPAALEPTSPVPAETGVDAAPPAVESQPVPAAVQTAPVAESTPVEATHKKENEPSAASEPVQPAPAETVPEAASQAPQAPSAPVVETAAPVTEPAPPVEAAPAVEVAPVAELVPIVQDKPAVDTITEAASAETVHQGEITQAAALEPVLETGPTQATKLPLVDDMTETSKESTPVGDSAMAPEMTQAN